MSWKFAAVGFAAGVATTILCSLFSIFLAVSGEREVAIGPIVRTDYFAGAKGGFEFESQLGWLGFALPIIGLVVGGATSVLRSN